MRVPVKKNYSEKERHYADLKCVNLDIIFILPLSKSNCYSHGAEQGHYQGLARFNLQFSSFCILTNAKYLLLLLFLF